MRKNGASIMLAILFIGIPVFLLMNMPWVFWLAFVPLVVLMVWSVVKWVKTGGWGFGHFFTFLGAFCAIIVLAFVVTLPEKCGHEDLGRLYSFQFEGSTASNYTREYCKDCEKKFRHTNFRGTPTDTSYLEALVEHSDGSEIVPSEYYTVTGIVTWGDYEYDTTRISCKVDNEDFVVIFAVEFKEGFEELVSTLEEGDEITFRGRFYDEGCGFTDCELIK